MFYVLIQLLLEDVMLYRVRILSYHKWMIKKLPNVQQKL